MWLSFKYRLFTNANQERELSTTLETHRRLYNQFLDERQLCWETAGVPLDTYFLCRRFTVLKRSNPYYVQLNVSSARLTIKQLDRAFKAFFARVKRGDKPGYPRFKSADRFNSFAFDMRNHGGGCKIVDNKLRLQGIGKLRICWHRPLPVKGNVRRATIIRENDKWFVCFCVELPNPAPTENVEGVGIDVGLESFLTTSDGDHEPNPRYLKDSLPNLRRDGRSVSRKRKGSKYLRKAVRRLRKTHARIRNKRREHHHQTALKLVRRYGFIAAERLNVKNMMGNRRLSRAIQDAGWSGFLNVLRYKAAKAGVQFVEVDPKGTSQTCTCGERVEKTLSQRWHDCPSCGLSLHRDHVSAKVILARGLARTAPAECKFGVT